MNRNAHRAALDRKRHPPELDDLPQFALPSEAERELADLERDRNKGPRLAAANDRRALEQQVLNLDAMRRAGW